MSHFFLVLSSFLFAFFGDLGDKKPSQKGEAVVEKLISEAQNGIPHNVEDVPGSFSGWNGETMGFFKRWAIQICFSLNEYSYYIFFFWQKNCVYPSIPPCTPLQKDNKVLSFALTFWDMPSIPLDIFFITPAGGSWF